MHRIKSKLLFLLQLRAILVGISAFIFGYVYITEMRENLAFGCYDCGFYIRQVFLILIASAALLVNRNWSLIISLLASLKVIYSIGYQTFWNLQIRDSVNQESFNQMSSWIIFRDSLIWSLETHPIWLVELLIVSIVFFYAISLLWKKHSYKF